MARRSWSASAGVKPAATMAIFIACSWNSGTPRVFSSTSSQFRRCGYSTVSLPLPSAQIGMDHVPLDRPGADDRDLDDQVVEVFGPQPRQHAHLRPALDLEHADRVGRADHVVDGRVLRRGWSAQRPGASRRQMTALEQVEALARSQVSIPSASTSTFKIPSASMSSLSHSITCGPAIAAFSIGHHLAQRPAGHHHAADVLAQMARETRAAPRRAPARARPSGRSGSRPARAAALLVDAAVPTSPRSCRPARRPCHPTGPSPCRRRARRRARGS